MGFLNDVKENVCISGFPENWNIHQMKESAKDFFTSLESVYIPNFFIDHGDKIKEIYESCETSDRHCQLQNLPDLNEKFFDFSEAMGSYMQEMSGKEVLESADYDELNQLTESVNHLLDTIFTEDEMTDHSVKDSLYCVECMIDTKNRISGLRDEIETNIQYLEGAFDEGYARDLAKLYLTMEATYAVDFLEQCESGFEKIGIALTESAENKSKEKEYQVF
ncbi:MAG TPA: hypothetical protein DCW90_09105 [Lachnospiraceae bacterium]|nr:hypothetical protein [Lachnospiraceae bacterium]